MACSQDVFMSDFFKKPFVGGVCYTACGILVLHPGIEPGPSAMKAWSPNLWTTRKFMSDILREALFSNTKQ